MKRLSKSASDISNCKKKTYSTSPEEEEREFDHESNYGNRRGGEYDEDGKRYFKFICTPSTNFVDLSCSKNASIQFQTKHTSVETYDR